MDKTRMLGPGEGYEAEGPDQEQGRNPLLVVHLLLQGRYWLAALLAAACALAGALLGYKLPKVTYSSTGTIHIRPVISAVLFDKSGAMPMYESFVMTQIGFIKSERCLSLAMSMPAWLNGARSNSDEAEAEFKKELDVARDGEFIHVSYTDPDPKTAQDAVAAVIGAYQTLVVDLDPENATKRAQQLDHLKTDYETKLADSKNRIAEAANPYTPDTLRARYSYKLMESLQAETEAKLSADAVAQWEIMYPQAVKALRARQEAPASQPAAAAAANPAATAPAGTNPMAPAATNPAVAAPAGTNPAATAPAAPAVYTAKQIADMGDPGMRSLMDAQTAAQNDLEALLMQVGPNHPLAQQARNRLALVNKRIEDYAQVWKPPERLATASAAGQPAAPGQTPEMIGEQLAAKALLDQKRLRTAQDEVNDLGDKVKKINLMESDIQQTTVWLEETKQKLEELRVMSESTGRLQILSTGERPVRKDRRLAIAGASGFGGVMLGFGLVLVLGLLDRRLRTIDQARMSLKQGMRVLGMLPSLPKNLEDPSAASFAALCVHHIRMLLQVMPRLDGHPAIAVTSPSPGDGKTSLTLALALSYAASGRSTLLIDCDIVGAGLSRRVNALIRRRIGQILIRENLITPAELREALSAAQRTGRKLGEVLVDEGYVEADQLAKALKLQGETSVGLLDVMRGEALEDCVADTGTPRLWILPVGSALAEHGATISPEGFRAVLDQARKRFEAVLVDTGPIPGSIESSVACSQADGVVLTVSRGEQGPLVKRASEHMRDIGARALGLVFNRAKPDDFSSSFGSLSSPSVPERVREKAGVDTTLFGPVASAVAGQQKTLKE